MKKVSLASLFVYLVLFLSSATTAVSKLFLADYKIPLIIAGAALAVSGIVTLLIKRSTFINIVCFIINSISLGLAVRGFYLFMGREIGFVTMLIISAMVTVCFFVLGLSIRIFHNTRKSIVYIIASIIYVLAIVGVGYIAYKTADIQLYTIAFYLTSVFGFIFTVGVNSDEMDTFFRSVVLSTCSIFAVVIGIVILIIALSSGDADCDCDCCGDEECLELWLGNSESGHKRRRKDDYDEPDFNAWAKRVK